MAVFEDQLIECYDNAVRADNAARMNKCKIETSNYYWLAFYYLEMTFYKVFGSDTVKGDGFGLLRTLKGK